MLNFYIKFSNQVQVYLMNNHLLEHAIFNKRKYFT